MSSTSLLRLWWKIEDWLFPRRYEASQLDWGDLAEDKSTTSTRDEREPLAHQLTDALARLDTIEATLAEQQSAFEQGQRRLSCQIDRSQTSIEKQLDAATAHFAQRTEEVANEAKQAKASVEDIRRAAIAIQDVLLHVKEFADAFEASLPEKAEHAIRALIEQIEQEEGVLALALANVGSFTGAISKTLERDQ